MIMLVACLAAFIIGAIAGYHSAGPRVVQAPMHDLELCDTCGSDPAACFYLCRVDPTIPTNR